MYKETIIYIVIGVFLLAISIIGMWEYLPEAFRGNRSWQAREAFFWKIPFFVGLFIIFFNLNELYKIFKNGNKNT